MINYDLKASAADSFKFEIRLSHLSLLFQHCATRGGSFLFYYVLPFGCFLFVLASTFLYFSHFFLFLCLCNLTCFLYYSSSFFLLSFCTLFVCIFNSRVPEAGNLHQRHSVKVRHLVFKFIDLKVFLFLRLAFILYCLLSSNFFS
jgi:hypothetical protein